MFPSSLNTVTAVKKIHVDLQVCTFSKMVPEFLLKSGQVHGLIASLRTSRLPLLTVDLGII